MLTLFPSGETVVPQQHKKHRRPTSTAIEYTNDTMPKACATTDSLHHHPIEGACILSAHVHALCVCVVWCGVCVCERERESARSRDERERRDRERVCV